MAQYFVGILLKYFGIRGEFLLVLRHWASQKLGRRFNQCFLNALMEAAQTAEDAYQAVKTFLKVKWEDFKIVFQKTMDYFKEDKLALDDEVLNSVSGGGWSEFWNKIKKPLTAVAVVAFMAVCGAVIGFDVAGPIGAAVGAVVGTVAGIGVAGMAIAEKGQL